MARRRFQRKLNGTHEEPLINLTPLIDVVFVILIMFIIIAPLLEVDHVELAQGAPQSSENSIAVQEKSPIAIHVRKDNQIYFRQKLVSIAELEDLLKQARQDYPKEKPQLFHDKEAHFGTYQSIKNIVEEAGFTQMDIILKPQ